MRESTSILTYGSLLTIASVFVMGAGWGPSGWATKPLSSLPVPNLPLLAFLVIELVLQVLFTLVFCLGHYLTARPLLAERRGGRSTRPGRCLGAASAGFWGSLGLAGMALTAVSGRGSGWGTVALVLVACLGAGTLAGGIAGWRSESMESSTRWLRISTVAGAVLFVLLAGVAVLQFTGEPEIGIIPGTWIHPLTGACLAGISACWTGGLPAFGSLVEQGFSPGRDPGRNARAGKAHRAIRRSIGS